MFCLLSVEDVSIMYAVLTTAVRTNGCLLLYDASHLVGTGQVSCFQVFRLLFPMCDSVVFHFFYWFNLTATIKLCQIGICGD